MSLPSQSSVLIFGAGYLGKKLALAIPGATLCTTDIADGTQVREVLRVAKPTHVINTAGKTGRPNVDWCEDHKTETSRSNVVGALILAEACAHADVHLTHLGSGCIFYGPSPHPDGWLETDHANPSAFYSRTKYATELVLSELPNVAVVRLRMPIDGVPGPRNLITKLASYPKVIDVANSVTVIDDLAAAVRAIIHHKATGVFHAVNDGVMLHRDLLALYRELVDPEHVNDWILNHELVGLGLAAKLRSNCILQNTRLRSLGVEMRHVATALRACMQQYARQRGTRGML